ncbi:hypothetical protein [Planotetraspora kaengkrachanensis]
MAPHARRQRASQATAGTSEAHILELTGLTWLTGGATVVYRRA